MEIVCFAFAGSGGTRLPAVIWTPEKPLAVLQIAHDILHDNPARTNMTQTILADWLEKQIRSVTHDPA